MRKETDLALTWGNDYMHVKYTPPSNPEGLSTDGVRDTMFSSLKADFNITASKVVSEAESNLRVLAKLIKSSSYDKYEEALVELTCSYQSFCYPRNQDNYSY